MRALVLAALLVGCGGPQPVQVTPSHDAVPVGSCVEIPLESQWNGRTPVPASDVAAKCADGKICRASISTVRAAVVFAQGLTPGSTSVEIDYLDPVTKDREHKAIRVTYTAPKQADAGAPAVINCDEAARAAQ